MASSKVCLLQASTSGPYRGQVSDSVFSPFTPLGCDAAFIGPNDGQIAILENDKTGLALYIIPGMSPKELDEKNRAALEENPTADAASSLFKGPLQFMFESEVDRIFSTPLGDHEICIHLIFDVLLECPSNYTL